MHSKKLLLLLIVNFVSYYSYGQKNKTFFRNDYKYIETTKGFYKIYTISETWSDAKRICALEGASLFYPEDEKEARDVMAYWQRTQNFEAVYVGISDRIVEGLFDTIDGKPISDVYHKWGSGEPNDAGGNEDCVALRKDGSYNDVVCATKWPFICKKSLKSLEWNYHCNMPNLDYVYVPTVHGQVGSCYKFHMTLLNWPDAYAACRAEQSYLAVINSRLEGEYLLWLTRTDPKYNITGHNDAEAVHLGFHNRVNEGWQTVKGTPLTNYDFAFWVNGHPGEGVSEQCGSMLYSGLLDYISCKTKCYFICEHDVHPSPM